MSSDVQMNHSTTVVVTPTKSMGISIILTIILGPLGMLYSTILGGVIMSILFVVIGIVTLGFGLIVLWPICVIWGALATNAYNQKILSGERRF